MAKVICFNCKSECKYNLDTGWWLCANGHGQILQTVLATENDLCVGKCPTCENTKELVKFPFEKT